MAPEQQTNQGSGSGSGKRRRRRRGRGSGGGQGQGGGAPGNGGQQRQQQQPQKAKHKGEHKSEEKPELKQVQPAPPHKPKRYGVIFYDTVMQARQDKDNLAAKAKEVDQLNIIIRAESDMDDPELTPFGKVFAGAAWTLIHERRVQDGWYDKPQ